MKAKLKFLRIAEEGGEFTLIIRNMLKEDQPPYIFCTGDQIIIGDYGDIKTVRRNPEFKIDTIPSLSWLENRLKELHWKIQNALKNDHFVSQTDVYERNYLLEIYNETMKRAEEHG